MVDHGYRRIPARSQGLLRAYHMGNQASKDRPGYELIGFTMRFWHKRAKRFVYAKPGHPFPIWRKVA